MPRREILSSEKEENKSKDILEGLPEIAAFIGKSHPTAQRWIKQNGLPAMLSPSGKWTTTKTIIRAWLIARGAADQLIRPMLRGPFPEQGALKQRQALRKPKEDRIDEEKNQVLASLYSGGDPYISARDKELKSNRAITNILLGESE